LDIRLSAILVLSLAGLSDEPGVFGFGHHPQLPGYFVAIRAGQANRADGINQGNIYEQAVRIWF
jgi:hypothetical protein